MHPQWICWFVGKEIKPFTNNCEWCMLCCVCFKHWRKWKRLATCEIKSVICSLNARGIKPVEILHKICDVNGKEAISDLILLRGWLFNKGCENATIFMMWQFQLKRISERTNDSLMSLSLHFPGISHSLLYTIISVKVNFFLIAYWNLFSG